mmetsp:Transcript_132340/g.257864  ORF Transcript_132340/g.257864 Transcript_132340/m.257864 type:complete len:115 (+) Transcript_132340:118-462(+)
MPCANWTSHDSTAVLGVASVLKLPGSPACGTGAMVSERWHVAQHVCAVKVKRHVLRTICSMAEHTLRSAVLLSLRIDTRVSSSAADTGHHVSHYPPQIDVIHAAVACATKTHAG